MIKLVAYDDENTIMNYMDLDITEDDLTTSGAVFEDNMIKIENSNIKPIFDVLYSLHTKHISPYNKYDVKIIMMIYQYISNNVSYEENEKIENIMLDLKKKYHYNTYGDALADYNFYVEIKFISGIYKFISDNKDYKFAIIRENEVDIYART